MVRFIPPLDRLTRPGDPPQDDPELPVQPLAMVLLNLSELQHRAGSQLVAGLPSLRASTERSRRIARWPFDSPLPVQPVWAILWWVNHLAFPRGHRYWLVRHLVVLNADDRTIAFIHVDAHYGSIQHLNPWTED